MRLLGKWGAVGCVGVLMVAVVTVCHGAAWSTAQIGPDTEGAAAIDADSVTITAVTGDIWGSADTAVYVYQEAIGDFEFSARVADYQPANPDWGKAGLMIRQSVDADSSNAFINMTGNNGMKLISRPATGADTGPSDAGVPYPDQVYLRLMRVDTLVTAFTSIDGVAWSEAGGGVGPSAVIEISDPVVFGLALSSNDPAAEASIRFDSFGGLVTPVEPQGKLALVWSSLKAHN